MKRSASWLAVLAAGVAFPASVAAGPYDRASAPAGGTPALITSQGRLVLDTPHGFSAPRWLTMPFAPGYSEATIAASGSESLVAVEGGYTESLDRHYRYVSNGVAVGAVAAAGELGPLTRLLPGPLTHHPLVAGSPAGDGLLAWGGNVMRREPAGAFRRPQSLGPVYVEDAGIDGDGRATVLARRGAAQLAFSADRAERFGEAATLPDADDGRLAVNGAGAALIALEGAGGTQVVYRPAGSSAFGGPQTVADRRAEELVDVALDSAGRGLVVWTEGGDSSDLRLRAALTDERGAVREAITLSSPGQSAWYSLAAAAMNEHGDAAVVWQQVAEPFASPRVMASYRRAGAGFGDPVEVTGPGRMADLSRPAVAVREDGVALVGWRDAQDRDDFTYVDAHDWAAHLTADGIRDAATVDSNLQPPPPLLTPRLQQVRLSLPRRLRVEDGGWMDVAVRCSSFSLDDCYGRVRFEERGSGSGRLLASTRYAARASRSTTVRLRLNRAARRALARRRSLRAVAVATVTGERGGGDRERVTLLAPRR